MHRSTSLIRHAGARLYADGSSWGKVIPLLQARGLHVTAVQNPTTNFQKWEADGYGALTDEAFVKDFAGDLPAAEARAYYAVQQRFMARRMGAKTIELRSSHVSLLSHPQEVAKLILDAAHAD